MNDADALVKIVSSSARTFAKSIIESKLLRFGTRDGGRF